MTNNLSSANFQPISQPYLSTQVTPTIVENPLVTKPEIDEKKRIQSSKIHHRKKSRFADPEIKAPINSSQEELIQFFTTKILPRWQQKYKLSDTTINGLKFIVKNFLDDHNTLRIICALGNEIAVAIDESMKQWGFPKWLSNTLYYGLWGVTLTSCAARAVLRGMGTQSWKIFTESSVQDAVAAIFGPTGIVLIANKIQNILYKSTNIVPQNLIHFIKPIISVTAAELAIPRILDPIGKYFAKLATGAGFVIKA